MSYASMASTGLPTSDLTKNSFTAGAGGSVSAVTSGGDQWTISETKNIKNVASAL